MKLRFLFLLCFPCLGFAAKSDESPVVEENSIRVELSGVDKSMLLHTKNVVIKQLKLSDDKAASAPLADDLAFFVLSSYRQAGFLHAEVDWALQDGKVILTVNEGPHHTVGAITFEGIDPALHEELKPYLTRQTLERAGKKLKEFPFVEADVIAGVGLVQRKLQADGYLDATVEAPKFTEVSGDKMDIYVKAVPGKKYVFDEVTLTGGTEGLAESIFEKVQSLKGQSFNEVSLEGVRKQIVGDCRARGYFAAEVTVQGSRLNNREGSVPMTLTVAPGELFKITDVRVKDGMSKGATRVASAVFRPVKGDRYEPEILELFDRRALDTGIFERLDATPVPTGPAEVTLEVSGKEARPKTLGVFGGYETFTGPIAGVEAKHTNFWDTGDTASIKAEWNARGLNANIRWMDPAIFDSLNSLAFDLSAETFSFKEYDRTTAGIRAGMMRRFTRRISAMLFTEYSYNFVSSYELTPLELGPTEYGSETLGGTLTLDYRDNPLTPHKGWKLAGGFETGQSGTSFVRVDLSGSWYKPLTDHVRFAVGGRASVIPGISNALELPIERRLFLGGATSVRSFAEREMGVLSGLGDTPLGGSSSAVMSAELSWEVISNLELAAFADVGRLGGQDFSYIDNQWRYAIGLGFRYNLPIGPLRVDYGFNPDRGEGEDFGALHITFGFAF